MKGDRLRLRDPLEAVRQAAEKPVDWISPSLILWIGDGLAAVASLAAILRLDPWARWMGTASVQDEWPDWAWVAVPGLMLWLLAQAKANRWPCRGVWPWSGYQAVEIGFILLGFWMVTGGILYPGDLWAWSLAGAAHVVLFFLALTVVRGICQAVVPGLGGDKFRERLVFVGRTRRMERVLTDAGRRMGSWQTVTGFLRDSQKATGCEGYRALGPLEEMEAVFDREKPTLLLVDEASVDAKELGRIAKLCVVRGVKLKTVPESFDFWIDHRIGTSVAGVPVSGLVNLRYSYPWHRALKRATDLAGSGIGLLLLSPLFLILTVLVRLDSPGPVFIRQRRLGVHGREFWILKFRTMRAGVENDRQEWAKDNDPRFTRLGGWLRAWHLDELPQLWNVLKGEMSLVGPRPEMADLVRAFSFSVHSYALRLCMKPGMTGWAAVHGFRGNTSLQERIDHDLFYIQNWSWWLDWKILLMTVIPAGFQRRTGRGGRRD